MASDHAHPPTAQEAAEARSEGRQGAVLAAGAWLLWLVGVILEHHAHVPHRAVAGYFWAAIAVSLLVVLSAPGAVRSIVDAFLWLGEALANNRPLREGWHRYYDGSRWFSVTTRISRSDIGSLWVPFVVQLIGLSWLIHYSGGFSESPFAAIPAVIFTIAVTIIRHPARGGRTGTGQGHPFLGLALTATVFSATQLWWDHAHPHKPADIDHDGVVAMTILTMYAGLGLAMLARLAAEPMVAVVPTTSAPDEGSPPDVDAETPRRHDPGPPPTPDGT